MQEQRCRPIAAPEKRIIVHNCLHFQQFSRPCAQANTFASAIAVLRSEAACVFCQQKDWLEHRHKLCLFGTPPDAAEPEADSGLQADEEADGPRHRLLKVGDAYYLANPERVQPLLSVERYAERWPLIPLEELHASSLQHPAHDRVGFSS